MDSWLREASRQLAPAETEPRCEWQPFEHQKPPPGAWYLWLLLAGRMAGKTDACAHYVDEHVQGPPCIPDYPGGHRVAIIAPTLGDAVEACVNGPSGIRAHNPAARMVQATGGTYVRWPNGTEAKLFGAFTPEDVERLRAGGNRCLVWAEELAAWPKLDEAWHQMRLGLRLGRRPHVVASTTPKPRKLLRELIAATTTTVTRARSSDNAMIDAAVRDALYAQYGGTRLGRQELDAELLEDIEGALWRLDAIDALRVEGHQPPVRVVVAIDPAVSSDEGASETGIVVAALGEDGHGYVLADLSLRETPAGWARVACAAYRRFMADRIVAEVNNGGEMVGYTLATIDPTAPFKAVHASRGKQPRAEPIAALYEQGRVHHVGSFPALEDQMCTWVQGQVSPDRMDALVWALTELFLEADDADATETYDDRVLIGPAY